MGRQGSKRHDLSREWIRTYEMRGRGEWPLGKRRFIAFPWSPSP
ncbi:hypothetical protein D779_3820 [Imhoffiella purpurea]|uniref:Uncharacterized protein n=1 Tax=Imhoffiella purpurea TaxID=1249627 RepID=W9V1L4_9GAMM|nr:hypothetical protein D779_3820 [Imhoffiella purpurea]